MGDPLKNICEDDLERRWVWISLIMALVMGGILGFYAVASNLHPPSNVETIDSARLHLTEEFAEDNLGVKEQADGSLRVTMVAARYGFFPPVIEVPTDTTVTFRRVHFISTKALAVSLTTMPLPQPAHQVVGKRDRRRKSLYIG